MKPKAKGSRHPSTPQEFAFVLHSSKLRIGNPRLGKLIHDEHGERGHKMSLPEYHKKVLAEMRSLREKEHIVDLHGAD